MFNLHLYTHLWWTAISTHIWPYLSQTFPTAFPFLSFLSKLFNSEISLILIQCVCFSIAIFSPRLLVFAFSRFACRFFFFLSPTSSSNIVWWSAQTGVASNFDFIYLCDQRCHFYIKKVLHTAANSRRHFCRYKMTTKGECIADDRDRRPKTQYGPSPLTERTTR